MNPVYVKVDPGKVNFGKDEDWVMSQAKQEVTRGKKILECAITSTSPCYVTLLPTSTCYVMSLPKSTCYVTALPTATPHHCLFPHATSHHCLHPHATSHHCLHPHATHPSCKIDCCLQKTGIPGL